ncbi:MAG TPA: helix-turn-helix transcriptional regulator [Kineosporiaceae bacterium]|nr:helix-turn-helix transcriptional regulator [Kineosporiaceae bacterium]
MTEATGSALVRRHIGRRFVALRQAAGLTQEEAARRLERSRATISRMEEGDEGVRFREVDVRQMLDVYGAADKDREVLLALTAETRNGRRKSWWHDYTETELPGWFGLYVSLEDAAETIYQYEPELLPGLLQTRAYAEAITRVPHGLLDGPEIQRRTEARMDRQSLLTRPRAPRLEVVISEAALHRVVGAGELAHEQLQHLLDITQRANVILQVLPWNAGIHAGMASSGGFSLLRFPPNPMTGEALEPPLAYVDSPTGAMYLTKPAEIRVYDLIWDDLMTKVLSHEDSRQLITTLKGLTP